MSPRIPASSRSRPTLPEQAEATLKKSAEADALTPILGAIPLQLIAYCAALERGCDVGRPRNLAKSVTVE